MTIDYVFPYVNCDDPVWQQTYNKYCEDHNITKKTAGNENARFRDLGDLLRFIFRSIAKNMPWINNIFFLVQSESQVPTWLDKSKVKIITHDKFIPARYLPTYNSTTIEMFLWNIPELGEYFIYGNDDLFALNECTEEDFFTTVGLPKLHLNYKAKSLGMNLFRQTIVKGQEMIRKDFPSVKISKDKFFKTNHLMTPMLKSTVEQVWKRHKINICNGISAFRTSENVNQYIYTFYQVFSGQYCDVVFYGKYMDTKSSSLATICETLKTSDYKIVCVNDSGLNNEKECIDLYNTFNELFSEKCKYEYSDSDETKSRVFNASNTLTKKDFKESTIKILELRRDKYILKYISEHKYPWILYITPYGYNQCFSDIQSIKGELTKISNKLKPIIDNIENLNKLKVLEATSTLKLEYTDYSIIKEPGFTTKIYINKQKYFIDDIQSTYIIINEIMSQLVDIDF